MSKGNNPYQNIVQKVDHWVKCTNNYNHLFEWFSSVIIKERQLFPETEITE